MVLLVDVLLSWWSWSLYKSSVVCVTYCLRERGVACLDAIAHSQIYVRENRKTLMNYTQKPTNRSLYHLECVRVWAFWIGISYNFHHYSFKDLHSDVWVICTFLKMGCSCISQWINTMWFKPWHKQWNITM